MTASLSVACIVRGQLAFTSTAGLPVSRRHCYSRGNRLRSGLHRPMSRVSSGSIVSDYGLDDRAIGVRYPGGAKDFFPIASVSRLALEPTQPPVQWIPEVLSPGLKGGRGVTLTTHPHLVPRSSMSRSYTSSPSKRLHGV
jgi:hypothetical protein